MNIICCIKQVPDTETQIKIGSNGKDIITEDIKWIMNPYDEFGIEEALRIQKDVGGEVTVIGVGPKRVTESLRTALAMGADKAILVEDDQSYGLDPIIIAKILAKLIKPLNSDIIFLGQRAVDDDCGLVGSALAELLGIPNLSVITKVELFDNKVRAVRSIEGQTLILESFLPVVITAQKGLNEPRYASLSGIMKAKKKPLMIMNLGDIGLEGEISKIQIKSIYPVPQRDIGKVVTGETSRDLAVNLLKYLHEEAKCI